MFVFTTKSMFPSAKVLAESLTQELGRKVYVTTNPETRLRGPVIRWGSGVDLPDHDDIDPGNNFEFILASANKRTFSSFMSRLDIPCVEIESGTPERFPVVIRETLTGFGGAGISICMNEGYWSTFGGSYWSYYRNFHPELGIHIFNGKILRVFKKVREDGLPREPFPIRNASRGYHFSLVDINNYPKLTPFVENFYKEFPIMFGRLDIGWDYDEKIYRIIEMNTAPCLTNNPDTLEVYTNAFMEVL